jgi:outer membrane murein-binding lipoprotein Lpp
MAEWLRPLLIATERAESMLLRGAILILAGVLLAGCANSQPLSTGFAAPAQAAEPDRDPSKKTLASKVLSAIALERVTGRKPDPSRLTELN